MLTSNYHSRSGESVRECPKTIRGARKLKENEPATKTLAIDLNFQQLTRVFAGGGGRLTSHKLEGLGLDGLVGVDFRNGTHFGSV